MSEIVSCYQNFKLQILKNFGQGILTLPDKRKFCLTIYTFLINRKINCLVFVSLCICMLKGLLLMEFFIVLSF